MNIKYDKYDLLWLFESEPDDFGEALPDFYIYSKKDNNGFRLTLSISIYEMKCCVSITFKELIVFNTNLKNVTSLDKHEDFLIVSVNNKPKLKLKFRKQLGVKLL